MDNQHLSTKQENILSNRYGTKNIVTICGEETTFEIFNKAGDLVGTMLIDTEDYGKIGLVRMHGKYACEAVKNGKFIHHLLLGHTSNREMVVDHINSNPLDNRKVNLRIVSVCENANNRNYGSNNTGVVGIVLRTHPVYNYTYYRATVSDRTTLMGTGRSKTRQVSKHFNIRKYGKDVAFLLAKEWIAKKQKEFGYLDKHVL